MGVLPDYFQQNPGKEQSDTQVLFKIWEKLGTGFWKGRDTVSQLISEKEELDPTCALSQWAEFYWNSKWCLSWNSHFLLDRCSTWSSGTGFYFD